LFHFKLKYRRVTSKRRKQGRKLRKRDMMITYFRIRKRGKRKKRKERK